MFDAECVSSAIRMWYKVQEKKQAKQKKKIASEKKYLDGNCVKNKSLLSASMSLVFTTPI